MRAMAINNFGGSEQMSLMDLPRPVPGKGEVLIRIRAAGVNPVDAKIRAGLLRFRMPHMFPVIPGWDASGVVEEAGEGCRRLKVGDEVFAYCRKPVIMHGAYAEYIAVDERNAALKPRSLSHEEAAAIPLSALTAWQSLFDAAGLRRGQSVLVHAAAGGVGGYAVQMARWKGAKVVATASGPNHEYVNSLGVRRVIDYTSTDFVSAVREFFPEGVDVAFDTVGGEVQNRSAAAVARGGTLVSILAYTREAELRAMGIQCKYVFVRPDGRQLARIASLIDAGKLRTHLSAVLPLEQAAKAHEMIETGHTRGKIVLSVA